MPKIKIAVIGVCLLVVLPTTGQAATPRISSPYVDKGKTTLQWMGYYSVDEDSDENDAWKQRILLGRGFTDYWKGSVRVSFEDEGGRDGHPGLKAFGVENTFQLTKKGEYFFDVGIKGDYEHNIHSDDADIATGRLLVAKDTEHFLHLLNVRVDHGVGGEGDNGFSAGISVSTRYKYSDEFQPGFEVYNEFGRLDNMHGFDNEDRSVGPVVTGQVGSFRYHAGYIFGVSDSATDGIAKLSLEYKF